MARTTCDAMIHDRRPVRLCLRAGAKQTNKKQTHNVPIEFGTIRPTVLIVTLESETFNAKPLLSQSR